VNWNAADDLARRVVAEEPGAAYVPPYENPRLWTGHSTLIDELADDLEAPPSAVVASVGGGGLLCGVYEGLERVGWAKTTVLAAETEGASCFHQALKAGEPVRLPSIDSVATSLGALEISQAALDRAENQPTTSLTCTDKEAVDACLRFAQDHRILVEPACGAALAMAYSDRLRPALIADAADGGDVVIEVCGGSGVTLDILADWQGAFGLKGE